MFIAKISFVLFAIGFCSGASVRKYGIDGGKDAEVGQFPFQVSVQYCLDGGVCEHVCSGMILDKNWVLTAAGCIGEARKIVVGETDLHGNKTFVGIAAKFANKGFDVISGISPNDIGLIKLAEPLTFNKTVNVAKLPQLGQTFNGTATLSGYGDVNKLRYVADLNIITYEKCRSVIDSQISGEDPLDEKSNLCTLNEVANTCDGDSGGPLIQDDVVIGIVSWYFNPCQRKNAPNVFTNVANFVDWINDTISKNQ